MVRLLASQRTALVVEQNSILVRAVPHTYAQNRRAGILRNRAPKRVV